jgi:hypothetical protein
MKRDLKGGASGVRLVSSLLFLLFLAPVFSCKKASGENSTSSTGAKKNVIAGTIYDAHGNKFKINGAGVTIHIYGNGDIGQSDPLFNVQMDANSHYEVQVPSNVYAVHARAYMQLNGKTVAIDLKPLDGKPDDINLPSDPGIVRDFALQLTGEIPGGDPATIQGYYGAKIWFGDGGYNFTSAGYWDNLSAKYPGAKVKFTLTPQSPLIDGTQAQTVQLDADIEDVKSGKWYVNVPYAVYRATALLITATGQQKPLSLSLIPNISTSNNYVDLSFPPDKSDPFGRPEKEQLAVWDN